MHSIPFAAAFAVMILAAGASVAQQGTPPPGPATAAGPGPRAGIGAGVGRDFTPGWAMMTPAERDAHRQQMSRVTTAEECRRVRDEHLRVMAERARERGMANMPIGRRDPCAKFQP